MIHNMQHDISLDVEEVHFVIETHVFDVCQVGKDTIFV